MTTNPSPLTYCNPLPLPDYPQGYASERPDAYPGWLNSGARRSFRETADPSVLHHDGAWYLYPSCGLAWVSRDFCTWDRVRMNLDRVGYAPTIAAWDGKFWLHASERTPLYVSDGPVGPWKEVGPVVGRDGRELPHHHDPMYFADDDGRIYLYWGCGGPGIWGAEMAPAAPHRAITDPKLLLSYDPSHEWERFGPFNEDPSQSWVEGPWMFKHGGRYFLTYCAPGTEFQSYGMGTYVSRSPLGPFEYQPRNPILSQRHGLLRGPGHGCIVRGPGDTIWAFYTCLRAYHHGFERRIGCDPAGFDQHGNLFVRDASEIPQLAPGARRDPELGNDAGWLPVSIAKPSRASSEAPGRVSSYANDHCMRTWWEAASGDREPWLEIDLRGPFRTRSARIIWAEPDLDYAKNQPGPMRYRLEGALGSGDEWVLLLDRTGSQTDYLIDYQPLSDQGIDRVRLTVTGAPPGVGVGVVDLSVFGVPGGGSR
jgi:xylan 1,4-beta-xylosidase